MKIETWLKQYKTNKSFVETTEARIEQYKYAIAHPEVWYKDFSLSSATLGMPGRPKGSKSSPVEVYVVEKTLDENIIKEWIKEDESRVFAKKMELQQIDMALLALTKQEKYIIELKYFEGMFWKDIEISYQEHFTQYITEIRLKQIRKEAIVKLEQILFPFYSKLI